MFAAIPVAFLAPGAGGGGGGGGGVTVSITPASQSQSGFANNWLFSASTANVTGGTASAFVWSFRNITAGLWTISGGQGTATATARVQNVPDGAEASAELVCTATVSGVDYSGSATLTYISLF